MTSKLSEALAKAQVDFPPVLKQVQGQVGNQKYKYADLGAVNDAIKAPLAKHGLCVTSRTILDEHGLRLETKLTHAPSGETEIAQWPLVIGRPQEMGSALSYARRYTICALLNIVGETDDDGAEGQKAPPANTPKVEPKKNLFMTTDMGEEVGFEKAQDYLKAIEDAFKVSVDPEGFWDTNSAHFQMWQTKVVKSGHPSAAEFNRVGKFIVDSLQGKAA